jgi:hypothetical protein
VCRVGGSCCEHHRHGDGFDQSVAATRRSAAQLGDRAAFAREVCRGRDALSRRTRRRQQRDGRRPAASCAHAAAPGPSRVRPGRPCRSRAIIPRRISRLPSRLSARRPQHCSCVDHVLTAPEIAAAVRRERGFVSRSLRNLSPGDSDEPSSHRGERHASGQRVDHTGQERRSGAGCARGNCPATACRSARCPGARVRANRARSCARRAGRIP